MVVIMADINLRETLQVFFYDFCMKGRVVVALKSLCFAIPESTALFLVLSSRNRIANQSLWHYRFIIGFLVAIITPKYLLQTNLHYMIEKVLLYGRKFLCFLDICVELLSF